MTDLTKAIEVDPTKCSRLFRRAEVYFELGQHMKALEDIQRGFDISAGILEAQYAASEAFALRGKIYLEGLGDSQQAIADLTHAIELNLFSENAFSKKDVLLLRAAAYEVQGETDKAEQDRAAADRYRNLVEHTVEQQ